MPNAMFALSLALAGCASAIAMPDVSADAKVARSPAALETLLAQYDRVHGPARDALARRIDDMAAQRYASVSRLFWYTDLAQAKAAARAERKPILALRMLGRLDEELSCANSRFFRATLYANKALSAYMKDNFVLYWSSERPVPKVTIDFGDGRTIESTTTGNSAHYILDEKGDVLDVIPGLYAPHAFRAELAASLDHAREVAQAAAHERSAKIIGYHKRRVAELSRVASRLNVYAMNGLRVSADAALSLAQRATISKAYVEIAQLRKITTAELTSIDEHEVSTWADFADQLWPRAPAIGRLAGAREALTDGMYLMTKFPLDEQSLGLVTRLHGADSPEMISRLAEHVRADSALNQVRLRPQIHAFLAEGRTDFAVINDFIYTTLFHTPKSDPWLGLRARRDFTGLPNDGAKMP